MSAGSWKLMVLPIIVVAAAQLFKREFGLKIQSMLAAAMLIPLGATGIWILGPAWDALGPYTGIGPALLGPLVWSTRVALTGWSLKK